ncbi:response regulator transcription factor [Metabacillus malikii]|uniref:Two-component system response regulator YesN n=1 Tax=Metabacillus malikii TaxID=1504265 RepID=A0ABT9ZMU4_9BACI|nr:response regulator transcription factor [Metabacillus malikii]MDQ0232535.1 two-component system response regulator YesN [Metabacillus malikii]
MYDVLLVDDERIILDGISKIINWQSLGLRLIGTARNGIEAYQLIKKNQPDIIICDIKMPGLTGLELVEKVAKEKINVKFIILSGFGEFNYAKQAMEYGVKQYLLKPCNEKHIVDALTSVKKELLIEEKRERFLDDMKSQLSQIQPYVKKQLLREFISTKLDNKRSVTFYERLIQVNFKGQTIRVMLIKPEGESFDEQMFVINNLGVDIFAPSVLSTTIGDYAIFIIAERSIEILKGKIEQLKHHFNAIYGLTLTIAISEHDHISKARALYLEALECLNHRFFLGDGSLITKKEIQQTKKKNQYEYDGKKLCLLIKSGNWEKVEKEIAAFFNEMTNMMLSTSLTRSYVMHLFMEIIQYSDSYCVKTYMEKMSSLMEMDTIQQMKSFFIQNAKQITDYHLERHMSNHSGIINNMISLVEQNLSNTELSLKWIANKVYMNPDYLGKLFKQETGEKFSSYVTRIRIERAIEQIQKMDDVKVFTLAEEIGYGDNPQYFSQVFKKYTGYTPSEYRKVIC